ncbi:MAG: hypothetical protein FJY21_12905 [Bacteroidetes bacterium]|nr:hypothetical protein [Bacteroidota bacterium]
MRTRIQNSDDLKAEILRLRNLRSDIEADLKGETEHLINRFRIPLMLFSKLNHWVSPLFKPGKSEAGSLNQDWVSSVFKIALPVLMNKLIFPKSGVFLKSVIELLSQNTAKKINKDVLSDLINKLSEWIKSGNRRKSRGAEIEDYGIPPDSETY